MRGLMFVTNFESVSNDSLYVSELLIKVLRLWVR